MKKIDFADFKPQFITGLVVNLLFLTILYTFSASYSNVQLPVGEYEDNIWKCSDVPSYIKPAFNFLDEGVFGEGQNPDYFRTIGYPALISFFFFLFGDYGLIALQIFQAILFAFIYPLVTATARLWFTEVDSRYFKLLFFSLLLSGTYFTRTPVILTDTIFTLFFMAGFYFGLRNYSDSRKWTWLLYIALISIAALIRPTLTLFPLLNFAMAYWAFKKYRLDAKRTIYKAISISMILFFTINISSYRNYYHYSFFSPSSVVGINAFHYLAKKVLVEEGKEKEFDQHAAKIDSLEDINEKTAMRKDVMFDAILNYPLSTIKVLLINSVNVLFAENLLSNTSYFFNYGWKEYKNACKPVKTSPVLFYATYFIMLIYAILWISFFAQLWLFLKKRNFEMLLIIGILLIMFILPAILTGDGGGRFRLPFEHLLFTFSFYAIFKRIGWSKS